MQSEWKNIDLITRNFLQVNVVLSQNAPTIVQEVVLMSNEQLASNIGGLLNLWLGITVMAAVEFVELICLIVKHVYNRWRQWAAEKVISPDSDGKVSNNKYTSAQHTRRVTI